MGEYEPKTFEVGDIITASDLNKMNAQILKNSQRPSGGNYVRYDIEDQGLNSVYKLFARNNIDAAEKNILLRLTYDPETNQYTADKTFQEVWEGYQWDESRAIFCNVYYSDARRNEIYQLIEINSNEAIFVRPYGPILLELVLTSDNTITETNLYPGITINGQYWDFLEDAHDIDLTDTINEMIDAKINAALANLNLTT